MCKHLYSKKKKNKFDSLKEPEPTLLGLCLIEDCDSVSGMAYVGEMRFPR